MDLDNIEDELKNDAPTLYGIGNSNPFSVPKNYFTDSAKVINSGICVENFRFSEEEEFLVPENYFSILTANINAAIALNTLNKELIEDGFSVPKGYFEELSLKIHSQIDLSVEASKTKVRRLFPNWIKYAAAACIAAIIGSVAFLNFNQNNVDKQLGKIPEQEIINYLQINADEGDTPAIIENLFPNINVADLGTDVSLEELELYINTTL